jgi:hypothetical protein
MLPVERVNGAIDVQSGADDTGLPLLILRTPYNVAWQRLPFSLAVSILSRPVLMSLSICAV